MNYTRTIIEDYPGYAIDSDGRAWTRLGREIERNEKGQIKTSLVIYLDTWIQLTSEKNVRYLCAMIRNEKGIKRVSIHRLVAKAFIPNPNNMPYVCHKDGNPKNNNVNNLYWGTAAMNVADKKKHGTANWWNYTNKLIPQKVKLARLLNVFFGWKIMKIYKVFGGIWGVSYSALSGAVRGIRWKNLAC